MDETPVRPTDPRLESTAAPVAGDTNKHSRQKHRKKPKRDFLAPRPRKRKRNLDAALPEEHVEVVDGAPVSAGKLEKATKKEKRGKKEKKEKKEKTARREKKRQRVDEGTDTGAEVAADDSFGLRDAERQQKSQEKDARRVAEEQRRAEAEARAAKRPPKYIVFAGNLPFTADETDIRKHFRACRNFGEILAVRILTKKGTEEPRGCAFVEFTDGACVAQALKLHHSLMDGRKINVEKTAGGGGNGVQRREKIRKVNERLNKERRTHFHRVVRANYDQGAAGKHTTFAYTPED